MRRSGSIALVALGLALAACRPAPPPAAHIALGSVSWPVGAVVVLDGTGSTDSSDRRLEYHWRLASLPAGSQARIAQPHLAVASFRPDREGEYGVVLVVSNGVLVAEARATVIAACGVAAPRIVLAPAPPAPRVGQPVELEATVTSPDEAPPCSLSRELRVEWELSGQPAGSTALLSGATGSNPWFVPDLPGRYLVTAIATDSAGLQSREELVVEVGACGAGTPEILELEAPSLTVGAAVRLGAAVSHSDNAPGCDLSPTLAYRWRFLSRPAGSQAALNDPALEAPSFVPDVPGTYAVELTVSDDQSRVAVRSVELTASSCGHHPPVVSTAIASPPLPNAGQAVALAAVVHYSDNEEGCGADQTHALRWRIERLPAGSRATLSDEAALRPWFTADVPGEYRVAVVATDETGLSSAAGFVEIHASICGSAPPVAAIEPPPSANVGGPVQIFARVTDADAAPPCSEPETFTHHWAFASLPAGSEAMLSSASAANPSFVPDVAGTYRLRLIAFDASGQGSEPAFASVEVASCGGRPPTATAWASPDSPGVGQAISLSSLIADPDNEAPCSAAQVFTREWSVEAVPPGSTAVIAGREAPTASFVPDVPGEYRVGFVATDSTGLRSAPVTVTFHVSACGAARPLASIAAPVTLSGVGEPIRLTGGATDPDNEAPCSAAQTFTYAWSFDRAPAGSAAAITPADATDPSFTPDLPGAYVVRLVAADSTGLESVAVTETFEVLSCGTAAPVPAPSASSYAPGIGQPVRLSAAATDADNEPPCDAGQTFSFRWSFVSQPAGSSARLNSPEATHPSFVPDLPGDYVVALRATDDTGLTGVQTLKISATSCGAAFPEAFATASPSSSVGAAVQLSAWASDADNDAPCEAGQSFSFDWTFLQLPAGSRASVSVPTAAATSFVPDLPGNYVLAVRATDSTGRRSGPHELVVAVSECGASAPVVVASASRSSPALGQQVTLSAAVEDTDNEAPCSAGQRHELLWSIEELPAGSRATLNDPSVLSPSFVPDVEGRYVFAAKATDSAGLSGLARIAVTARTCGGNPPSATVVLNPVVPAIGGVVRFEPSVVDADNSLECRSGDDPPALQTFSFEWALLASPVGSAARLSSGDARTPSMEIDREGTYAVALVVRDSTGLRSEPVPVEFTVGPCGSHPPTAVRPVATPASISAGGLVALAASFADADNEQGCLSVIGEPQSHSFSWRVAAAPAGSRATIAGADRLDASLVPDLPGSYRLELEVTDSTGRNARGQVDVSVTDCGSTAPTAAAALDPSSELLVGGTIVLRSNASDADNLSGCGAAQTLSYQWYFLEQPAGSRATFGSSVVRDASFVPDAPGAWVAALVVMDSTGLRSAVSTIEVMIQPCGGHEPVARANMVSPYGTAPAADTVVAPLLSCRFQLDSRGSTDDDAMCGLPQSSSELSYRWEQTEAPLGSRSRLVSEDRANPWFDVDRGGTYAFRLWAGDGESWSSAPATVRIVHDGFWIERVSPAVSCIGGVPGTMTLEAGGQGFLRTASALPEVTFDGVSRTVTSMSGCAPSGVEGVESCSSLTFELWSITTVGDYPISVRNPVQDGCAAQAVFSVGPSPTITSVSPSEVCSADDPFLPDAFTLNVRGSGFMRATEVSLSGGVTPASQTYVSSSELQAFFRTPDPGSYDVFVSNGEGCGTSLPGALKVLPVPLVFFVDPPVIFSGISTQVTLYVSGLNGGNVSLVRARRRGSPSFIELDFTYDSARPNQVQAVIPSGLADGDYDVMLTDASSCTSETVHGFSVTGASTVALATIDPPFGWTQEDVAVDLRIANPLPGGMVSFGGAPRIYLNPTGGGGIAQGLSSIAVVDEMHAQAVIRAGLPLGTYDVIVVNEDGSVGIMEGGFRINQDPPPIVDVAAPGSIPTGAGREVKIHGRNFNLPSVRLECLASDGGVSTHAVSVNSASSTVLNTTVPGAELSQGMICIVIVTNPDGSFGEFSAIGVTNPAENLPPFKLDREMNHARRAALTTSGRPTRVARFVYAMGGDSGSVAGAMTSVEAAPLDRFGTLGPWRMLPLDLPAPLSFAGIRTIGRFIYLTGGENGSGVQSATYRAEILDPARAPQVDDLFLELREQGLEEGLWFYRVSAVMSAADLSNPGGETLASDPLPVRIPEGLPQRLRATIRWSAVAGASAYRIYRSPVADLGAEHVRLLATVPASQQSYVDGGGSTGSERPRRLGDLGAWRALGDLNVPRSGHGFTSARDPDDPSRHYLYAISGRTGGTVTSGDYEVLDVRVHADGSQDVAAGWRHVEDNLITGRWQAAAWLTDMSVTTRIADKDSWVHLGTGRSGGGSMVNSTFGARVRPGGLLSPWQSERSPTNRAGYGFAAAANQLFLFGGHNGNPHTGGLSSALCSAGSVCLDPPVLDGWSAGSSLSVGRALMGSVVESARIFMVGGTTDSGVTRSVESTIW